MPRLIELRLESSHQVLLTKVRQSRLSRGEESPLSDKIAHHAMEGCTVVKPRLRQSKKIADVIRSQVGKEFERDFSQRGLQHGPVFCQFFRRALREGRRRDRAGRTKSHLMDPRRFHRDGARVGRCFRDLIHDLDPFSHKTEHGVLPVKGRLRNHGDEELVAATVRLSRKKDTRQSSAHVLEVGDLALDFVQPAGSPKTLLSRVPG